MYKNLIRSAVALGLVAAIMAPSASFAAETIIRQAPSPSIAELTSPRDAKIIDKLLQIRQDLLKVVNQGFDVSISKLPADTPDMTREYFVQERNAYADRVLAVYGEIESDRASHGLWVGAGDYYLGELKDALAGYKSDAKFLRAYAANPSAYDLSDADRKATEERMLAMQGVLVDAWDKWVGPYLREDYRETGKMDMSFESDVVDASLTYDSYTSIFSILRGEQSADVKAALALEFKKHDALPTELQGKTANISVDASVKSFSQSGTYVTVRDMSVVISGGLTTEEDAAIREFTDSVRGKTIYIPVGKLNGGAPSWDVVIKALDQAVRSLAETPVFLPIIRNNQGDALLAVNRDAINQVTETLVREFGVSSSDLSSSDDALIVVPGVVWREEKPGQGEFYRVFTPARDGSTGYARLGYDDANDSLVFSARLSEETFNGESTFSIDFTRDRYLATLYVPGVVGIKLDWTDRAFDLDATSLEEDEDDRTMLTIDGVANFDSRVNLVAQLDGKRLFSADYELVDNRSTYSFELTSELPAYTLSAEVIPFVFKFNGYYDSELGSFPIQAPATFVEFDDWAEAVGSDSDLLDGLLQLR